MKKEEIKEKESKLLELTGSFCAQKLDDDYYELCEKMVKKMGRKKDVPFQRGRLEIWAAAIIHSIGTVNFLFDKNTVPYVSAENIADFFGVSQSTMSQKASLIRNMFKMTYFDDQFCTKSMKESDPFNNMVVVDGIIVPITYLPEEYQQMVLEARSQGEDISFHTKPYSQENE